MKPEKWQQVKEIFTAALEIAPDERAAFLSEAGADNDDVRREVEILLHSFESGYLEEPIVDKIAEKIVENQLTAGQKIKHYEIRKKIGAGGMGEVYLAQDTQLQRPVAIKILLSGTTFNKQAEKRLLREAQSAAVLNHPNICTIYEIGTSKNRSFIVMEYIEGETLEARIKRKSLTVAESVEIALNIANALVEAHSFGIVHRDIKPSNVIISSRGQIKVLDFSLAKKIYADDDEKTQTLLSEAGIIAGTVAYMSPEQARGKEIDARSDIWSLGVCLYEMLTGSLPFAGETKSDIIAAILQNEPPPLKKHFGNLPRKIENVIGKALNKESDARYQTIEDFAADLRQLQSRLDSNSENETTPKISERQTAESPKIISNQPFEAAKLSTFEIKPETAESEIFASRKTPAAKSKTAKIIIFAILFAALSGIAIWQFVRLKKSNSFPFTAESRASLQISTLFSTKRKPNGAITDLSFSPDGNLFVFLLSGEGKSSIFVKQLSGDEPVKVTDGKWVDRSPVWSPDGQRIAFVSNRDNKNGIWAVSYLGGTPILLRPLDFSQHRFQLKKWSKNGKEIYFESKNILYSLDLESGEITSIVAPNGTNPGSFRISNDEAMLTFVTFEDGKEQIWIQFLRGGVQKRITQNLNHNWFPVWFPDNQHLAYSSDQNGNFQLYVLNIQDGKATQITFSDTEASTPIISSDGQKIVFFSENDEANIFSYDLDSGKETPQTANVKLQLFPDISPDGKRMSFQSTSDMAKIFASPLKIKSVNTERESLTVNNQGGVAKWSPDGKTLAFLRASDKGRILWKVNIDDHKEKQLTTDAVFINGYTISPVDLMSTAFNWSSDGSRIAYISKKSGQLNVWTTSPESANEQIWTNNTESNSTLDSPIWSPEGNRIAYISSKNPATSAEKSQRQVNIVETGKSVAIFQTESNIRLLGWSALGNDIFVAVKDGTEIAVFKISTIIGEKPKQIIKLSDANLHGIRISPNRKEIAFSARRGGNDNVYMVSVNGGEIRQLSANLDATIFYSGITWSPDGKSLYYSKQTGGMQISMIYKPK